MAKTRRGKVLWKLSAHGRGTCPICHKTRVKLLWPRMVNGENVEVCKRCRLKSH